MCLASIKTELLQNRVAGRLTKPEHVLGIVQKHQPPQGLPNQDWIAICDFILILEKADNIPAAKELAEEHNLEFSV